MMHVYSPGSDEAETGRALQLTTINPCQVGKLQVKA